MELIAPIRRHVATAIAMTGLVALPAASITGTAQNPSGQKPAGQTKPAPATPAPKPAAKPAAKPAPQTAPKGTVDRYTATAVNLKAVAGETITVDLIRWTTDAEREKLLATFTKDEKQVGPALAAAPNIGYIWRSGSAFGSFVRYAHKFKASDGEHIILATDADLSTWQAGTGNKPAEPTAYTVIEILMPGAGAAAGKMSLGGKVVVDNEHKTIRLDNYAAAPVALKGVRHMRGAS